jgi:hypothetical protein
MPQVISISSPTQLPIPQSELYGKEVRKYYADGVISIIRTNPGKKTPNVPLWLQVSDDGSLKNTHMRIISTEVRDENVTRFWILDDSRELHEYLSPKKFQGSYEIRTSQ